MVSWESLIDATAKRFLQVHAIDTERERKLMWTIDWHDWMSRYPRYADRSRELRGRLREAGQDGFYPGATPSTRHRYIDALVKVRGKKRRQWKQIPNPHYRNPPRSQPSLASMGTEIQWRVFG